MNFLDTNVWLALVWERHSHAELARESVHAARSSPAAHHQSGHGRTGQKYDGSVGVYDRCYADERIALLPEPEGLDPRFRALAKSRQPSPNVWADAYLAAFASAAGLKLVTFDKALRSRAPECLVLG